MVYFGVKPLSHTSAGQGLQSEFFSARISRSVEPVAFKHTWMSGDALMFFCIMYPWNKSDASGLKENCSMYSFIKGIEVFVPALNVCAKCSL